MQITTVKIQQNGYLVDGVMSVPMAIGNSDYIAVTNWILGKTHDWLLLEETFNNETTIHDNWLNIQSYDADMIQYDIDAAAHTDWVFDESEPVRPDIPTPISKPKGYYTQTEVDDSVILHDTWQTGYDTWVADPDPIKSLSYWIAEPAIYQIPTNVAEPNITILPALVPNVPEAEFSLIEYKANKETELKRMCNLDIESGFTSNATGTTYLYQSTLRDQLNISGAVQANVDIMFTVIDNNNKIRVNHNNTQMTQVFVDGITFKQTKIDLLYSLLGQVSSAVNEVAVDAVVWS